MAGARWSRGARSAASTWPCASHAVGYTYTQPLKLIYPNLHDARFARFARPTGLGWLLRRARLRPSPAEPRLAARLPRRRGGGGTAVLVEVLGLGAAASRPYPFLCLKATQTLAMMVRSDVSRAFLRQHRGGGPSTRSCGAARHGRRNERRRFGPRDARAAVAPLGDHAPRLSAHVG